MATHPGVETNKSRHSNGAEHSKVAELTVFRDKLPPELNDASDKLFVLASLESPRWGADVIEYLKVAFYRLLYDKQNHLPDAWETARTVFTFRIVRLHNIKRRSRPRRSPSL